MSLIPVSYFNYKHQPLSDFKRQPEMKALMKNAHKVKPQLLASLIASCAFFCLGTIRGWSSPGIPSLNKTLNAEDNLDVNSPTYFELSETDLSWISSLPTLVAPFSSVLISFPLQYFGRRKALIGLSIPGIIGFLLMGFTFFIRHKSVLYLGRLMTAIMGGAAPPAAQIYISECSSPRIRGILGSLTASALSLGILVTYIIGAFVEWQVLAWIVGCFPLAFLVGMIFMPETPSWLLAHDLEEDARKALQRLRGERTDTEAELQSLKISLEKSCVNGVQKTIKLKELMTGSVLKPFGISLGLMFFQQFTGINVFIYNTVSIFQSAGSSIEPRYATIIVGVVQLFFTITSGFFVDRFGRRILLLGSGFVVSLSLGSMGLFFYLQQQWGEAEATAIIGWLPLVSLMIFFVAYSSGYASVPYIIMGEMLPSRYRNIMGPISTSVNVLTAFTAIQSFPTMQQSLGNDGTFWLFMSSTILSLAFIYILLPETKGKTLEEIEKIFAKKSLADEPSVSYLPKSMDGFERQQEESLNINTNVCQDFGPKVPKEGTMFNQEFNNVINSNADNDQDGQYDHNAHLVSPI